MTQDKACQQILDRLPLAAWRYYPRVGSTNDLALAWAGEGAPDWSLVLADEQTAGRGRAARQWVTRPGTALALSLVLHLGPAEADCLPRFTALAALALIRALAREGLQAELKWPNDVLLDGRKAAGILVEADWQDERLDSLVVGMGVNVAPGSAPEAGQLRYPATSVADILGKPVDRWVLLGQILEEMMALRDILPGERFLEEWNQVLALRGQWVRFREAQAENPQVRVVRILGVGGSGELVFEDEVGEAASAFAGEILLTDH